MKGIWIPIEIWQAEDLSWNEKVLLMEIDSFTSRGRDCYISNEYIGELLGVAPRTACRYLSNLIDKGLVRLVKFDGRARYVESTLPSWRGRVEEDGEADSPKMAKQTRQNCPPTNIRDINKRTDNNTPLPPKFNFRQGLINAGVSASTADQWLEVRRVKRLANTEIALRDTLREIGRCGKSAEACIQAAVARSWGGFKADWLARDEQDARRGGKPKDGDAMMKMYEALQRSQQFNPDDLPDTPDEQ